MKGSFTVYCMKCKKRLDHFEILDTADDSSKLGERLQRKLLVHQGECKVLAAFARGEGK